MSGLWSIFSTWNHANVMSQRNQKREALSFQGALAAEDAVAEVVHMLGHSTDNIHLRKRVFVEEEQRNREIDVIAVVTDALLVIEVKNWSGDIWRDGRTWFQKPPVGRPLQFGDLMGELEVKADALLLRLQRDRNIVVPKKAVKLCIVFANRKARVDPVLLRDEANVFTLEKFEKVVSAPTPWQDSITYYAPILNMLRGSSSSSVIFSGAEKHRISNAVESLRTWDVVILHNGTTLTGDILCVDCKSVSLHADRKVIAILSLYWNDCTVWGLMKSLWAGSAGTLRITFTEEKRRTMLHALEKSRNKMRSGKSGEGARSASGTSSSEGNRIFQFVDDEGNVAVPISKSTSATKRNTGGGGQKGNSGVGKALHPNTDVMQCNENTDHLLFRPAGNPHYCRIEIAQIRSLSFSPRYATAAE